MDPITLAIVAGIAAGLAPGLAAGTKKVSEQVIVDAYTGLKSLIKRKFGDDSKIVQAIDTVEEEPEFEPNKLALQERVKAAKAIEDPELMAAAQDLLDKLNAKPDGQQAIQHIQNVYGNYSAAAGPYGTATVNVGKPEE